MFNVEVHELHIVGWQAQSHASSQTWYHDIAYACIGCHKPRILSCSVHQLLDELFLKIPGRVLCRTIEAQQQHSSDNSFLTGKAFSAEELLLPHYHAREWCGAVAITFLTVML